MLSYSPTFVSKLNRGDSAAWLADQKTKFDLYKNQSCTTLSWLDLKTATNCVLYEQYKLKWHDFISGFVLSGWFPSSSSGGPSLSSTMTWSQDKSLLLASTLLTHNVVLQGSKTGDKSYYWLCNKLARPSLKNEDVTGFKNDGDKGGFCTPLVNPSIHPTPPIYPDAIPVTFSHVAAGAAPPFMPGLGPKLTASAYNIGYTKNNFSGAPLDQARLENPLDSSKVDVVAAAAASSAAAGYGASEDVVPIPVGKWEEAWAASDLAVSFSLASGVVKQTPAPTSFSDLQQQKIVRLADGGVVDNTGVVQLVSYLQKSNPAGPIAIVAFDNYQHGYGANGFSDDFLHMLGFNNPASGKVTFQGATVRIPDLQIFDKSGSTPPSATASSPLSLKNCSGASPADSLYYFSFTATTRQNEALGIRAGTSVNLHVFSSASPALTAPVTVDTDFDCYNALLAGIKADAAMKPYLKKALHL